MRESDLQNRGHFYAYKGPGILPVSLPNIHAKAGFHSPAESWSEEDIDLVKLYGLMKPSVYYMRVDGDSMKDQFIPDKSLLVVDRALDWKVGDLVVAILNGGFVVKRLSKEHLGYILYSANPNYEPILIDKENNFEIWGVVAHVFHSFRDNQERIKGNG